MVPASGRQVLTAAAIVGVAVIASSLILAQSISGVTRELERAAGQIEAVGVAFGSANEALANRNAAPPTARRGPDPDRRYTVNTEGSPAIGPETAAVTMVEFSDFQCPFCARVGPTLTQIKEQYGDDVRIVFKHLPLSMHAKAPAAHAAAEAASRQDKFWEMHDKIFANQREMSPEKYVEYATELGLDVERFERDVASAEVKKRIDADTTEAARLGATGTPSFYVNGLFVSGAKPFEAFKEIIDEELALKKKT
jgi:protein-disulfide isomerase